MSENYFIPPYRIDSPVFDSIALAQTYGWGQEDRKISDQWENSTGRGVLCVVLDTGSPRHKDLPTAIFEHDFTRSQVIDRQGHGTHCAGIVAAKDNDSGVVGWAPGADLGFCKVLSDSGSGRGDWVTAGIRKAIQEYKTRKADYVGCVLSISIGGPYDADEDRACKEADEAGIIVVAAAGNSGANAGVDSPGDFKTTLATAAYRSDGKIATFSSGGKEVDFAMPGQKILSTVPGDGFQVMSGTSMATPALAGLIACVLSSRPNDTEIRNYAGMKALLAKSVEDRGAPGKDDRFGIGVPTAENTIQDPDFLFI
jgi:subtilisin family serine protease